MPIEVTCPGCQGIITFGDEAAGRAGRCPECDQRLKVPRSTRRRSFGGGSRRAVTFWAIGSVGLLLAVGGAGAFFLRHSPKTEESSAPPPSRGTPAASSGRGPLPRLANFARAQPLKVDSDGTASQTGRFETADDEDIYRFEAPLRGLMTVRQKGASAGKPECRLTVYNADQKELEAAKIVMVSPSEISFRVTVDGIYYVKAAAAGKRAGAYELVLSTQADDFGDTFETAERITLDTSGSGHQDGRIDFPGDEDMFRLEATITGKMMVRLERPPESRLLTALTVYNGKQQKMGQNQEEDSPGLGSRVEVNVVKGQTYYVKAAANRNPPDFETGAYRLLIQIDSPQSLGNDFTTAKRVDLSPKGAGVQNGRIRTKGDVNFYRFTATVTGTMTIKQEALEDSKLDSELFVYDDKRQEIAHNDNDDVNPSANSRVDFPVVAGRTYYVKAAAADDQGAGIDYATGPYRLALTTAVRSSDWKEFTYKDGTFSVCLPETPKEETKPTKTLAGDIDLHTLSADVPGTTAFCMILFEDFPQDLVKGLDSEELFDNTRDSELKSLKGKLLEEKKIKLGKYPGREILFMAYETFHARARLYLVEGRLYVVMVIGDKDLVTSAKVDNDYFATFTVNPK